MRLSGSRMCARRWKSNSAYQTTRVGSENVRENIPVEAALKLLTAERVRIGWFLYRFKEQVALLPNCEIIQQFK